MNPLPDNTTCPRCGDTFRCGAGDAAPCACGRITLTDAHRAQLGAAWSTCVCRRCLTDIAAGQPVMPLPAGA